MRYRCRTQHQEPVKETKTFEVYSETKRLVCASYEDACTEAIKLAREIGYAAASICGPNGPTHVQRYNRDGAGQVTTMVYSREKFCDVSTIVG